MLNPQEVRIIAFVLSLAFLGVVVQACREKPHVVHRPESDVMKEHTFKKKRPVKAPD